MPGRGPVLARMMLTAAAAMLPLARLWYLLEAASPQSTASSLARVNRVYKIDCDFSNSV